MLGFTNNFSKTAQRLIQSAGFTVTYSVVSQGSYDTTTHTVTQTTSTQTFKAFQAALSFSETKDTNFVGKTMAAFMIASLDFTGIPKAGDKLTTTTGTYQVERVTSASYSAGPAYWRVLVSRT